VNVDVSGSNYVGYSARSFGFLGNRLAMRIRALLKCVRMAATTGPTTANTTNDADWSLCAMDVEFWNSAFKTVAMWTGIVTALAAGAGWYTESIVSGRQAERIRALEKDVAVARLKQTELEKEVSDAKAQQAKQQERAAIAERILEEERNARLRLERRTANRWLEPGVFKKLSSDMAKFSGQSAEVVVFPVTFESVAVADHIHGILGNAKWNAGLSAKRLKEAPEIPTQAGTMAPLMVQGVFIKASDDAPSKEAARALADGLSTTVAAATFDVMPWPGPPRVFVFIGDKPAQLSIWVKE
jgi:hypothetical protein